MAQSGSAYFGNGGGSGDGFNSVADPPREGKERGSRRRKLAGYLKAANELRQSYQQTAVEKWSSRGVETNDEDYSIPGAFPDIEIIRHGHEELVLFPSYCKRHRRQGRSQFYSLKQEEKNASEGGNTAEWWKQEWERLEDDKAIVDVDVRGWLYSPHRGPFSRKNRLLIGLARQLSGISAPKPKSRDTSPDPLSSLRERHEEHEARKEEEKIAQEAEKILRRGEGERQIAARGGYSEDPNNPNYDRDRVAESMQFERFRSSESGQSTPTLDDRRFEEPPVPGSLAKRASWNHPSDMDAKELATANANLMSRLMPFLTNPAVGTPVTVFFYDEKSSVSRTVRTDEAGHFNLRTALDFIPTHARVLASEGLSVTSEVKITEPKGVSIISDVDDTIKHSSIGSGAREIFRNAFIRDLTDLTIDGVREWYNTMYDMGCGIHYVSNSPWQLFPVLATFFRAAGLPPGSYHLKQYSGMLQGIFEPVAERKKGTLDRIMRDFPERRFLLIGDSGEADLELYTDLAVANPGRVIGIYIRDVTTPLFPGFFDSAMGSFSSDSYSRRQKKKKSRGWSGDSGSTRWSVDSDSIDKRPPLPSRILTEASAPGDIGGATGNLIDFEEEPEEMDINESSQASTQYTSDLAELVGSKSGPKVPPQRPSKPLALRSKTIDSSSSTTKPSTAPGSPTIRPTQTSPILRSIPGSPILRPLTRIFPGSGSGGYNDSHHPLSQTQNTSEFSPRPSISSGARNKAPSTTSEPIPLPTPARPIHRRSLTSTVSNRLSWTNTNNRSGDASEDDSNNYSPTSSPTTTQYHHPQYPQHSPQPQAQPPQSKKVELWKRRWRRARDILEPHGVELRSWRHGEDVCLDAVRLVEKNLRELGVEGHGGKEKTGEGGGEVKVKELKR